MKERFNTTYNMKGDKRPLSQPVERTFMNRLSHFFGCYYLESMSHASANECLYCGYTQKEKREGLHK